MATLAALGIIIILFGGVWLIALPELPARETRGVTIGAFFVGALLLVAGLL